MSVWIFFDLFAMMWQRAEEAIKHGFFFSTEKFCRVFSFFFFLHISQGVFTRVVGVSAGCRPTCAGQFGPFEGGCTPGWVGASCSHVLPLRRTKKQFHSSTCAKTIMRKGKSHENEESRSEESKTRTRHSLNAKLAFLPFRATQVLFVCFELMFFFFDRDWRSVIFTVVVPDLVRIVRVSSCVSSYFMSAMF